MSACPIHPAPCHRAEGRSLTREGRSPAHSHRNPGASVGSGAGLALLSHSPPLGSAGEGAFVQERQTGQLPAGCGPSRAPARALRGCWGSLGLAARSCPPTAFWGLNNFLFLKDKSYLVLIHKVSEVLGELLFTFRPNPGQGPGRSLRRPGTRG